MRPIKPRFCKVVVVIGVAVAAGAADGASEGEGDGSGVISCASSPVAAARTMEKMMA